MSSSNRVDHRVGVHAFGLGLEVCGDAMAKHRQRDPFDVVGINAEASVHRGKCFGAGDQVLTGPRSGSPINQFTNILGCRFVAGPRGAQRAAMRNESRTD